SGKTGLRLRVSPRRSPRSRRAAPGTRACAWCASSTVWSGSRRQPGAGGGTRDSTLECAHERTRTMRDQGLSAAVCVVAMLALAPAVARAQDDAVAKRAYDRALTLESQGNQAAALSLLWEAARPAPHQPDIHHAL